MGYGSGSKRKKNMPRRGMKEDSQTFQRLVKG